MSYQPYFNENACAYPFLNPRPWYYGYYESVTYSVVPFCSHPRVHLSDIYSPVTIDPSNLFVVVPSFSPVVFNHQQSESSYYGGAASAINACSVEVEKPNIINIPSGEKATVKSHLSNSFEKSKFNKATIKAITSSKHPDTETMEQIECREKADISSVLDLLQEPAYSQNYDESDNTFSEFQAGTNSSISSQSCYLSASCLHLSKENPTYVNSSLNEEFDYECEEQHSVFSTVENGTGTDTDLVGNTDFSYFKENQNEDKCNDLDDDSELEYHSAEEYDYLDSNYLCRQEREKSGVFPKKDLINEDTINNHEPSLNNLEEGFSTANCSSIKDHYNCNEIPAFPQMFQDVSGTEIQYMNVDNKDETQDMFYSVVEDSSHVEANKEYNPKLFSGNRAAIEEKTEMNILRNGTLAAVMPANKEMFKKNSSVSKNISQKTGNPETLQQEKMLLLHTSGSNPESSNSCTHEQSFVINANTENCVYNSCGCHGQCRENFSNVELKSAKISQSTVHEAVDATADFRASFTTSRATSVSSSMVSKAQNTVITMMSKRRPKEWMEEFCKSVACNTDWSCIPDSMEISQSQREMTDTLENCITSGATIHGWKLNTEDPLDWSNGTCRDLNEIPYSTPLGSGKPLSELLLSQDNESSSLHLIKAQMNVNSDPQQFPSNENSEKRKTTLEEKKTQTTEEQKKELKNNYCVHVGGLSPLVSEIDLWLHFQKYNVTEISICEYSENYRYASLGFKIAHDAKLAVKETNNQEIKGKAVNVRLVRTIKENGVQDYQGCMKAIKKNDCVKNSDLLLEVPAMPSATFTLPPDPICLKKSVVSNDDFKSRFPVLPASTSSEMPPCTSGQPKVLNSDNSSTKACFELKQEDIGEDLLPVGLVQFTPDLSSIFIPPNALNLRNFRKVVKKLEDLHPEISRDNILDALTEIKEDNGFLRSLPLSTIVQMTSSLLNKKFACQSQKSAI